MRKEYRDIIYIVIVACGFIYAYCYKSNRMGMFSDLFNWFKPNHNKEELSASNYISDNALKTLDDYNAMFKHIGYESLFDKVKPIFRTAIDISFTEDVEETLGMSKLGGCPDLSKNIEWPVDAKNIPQSFVGQINLSDVSEFDVDGLLPTKGLLSFFFCQDQDFYGNVEKDRLQFRVIYQENIDNIEQRKFPEGASEQIQFIPTKMEFSNILSLPTYVHPFIDSLNLKDNEEDILTEIHGDLSRGKMLGYADEIQNYMESECALSEIGITYGPGIDYKEPHIHDVMSRQFDWILLFQVPSDVANMMWGDTGNLYFWIKRQDLANRDFSKCWCIEQCY